MARRRVDPTHRALSASEMSDALIACGPLPLQIIDKTINKKSGDSSAADQTKSDSSYE